MKWVWRVSYLLAVGGCLGGIISAIIGRAGVDLIMWPAVTLLWIGNQAVTRHTAETWRRLYEGEKQRRLAMWS